MSDWRVDTGDCREVMAAMDDNSVDAIVTDPPYGLGKEPDALAMLADWLQYGHHEVKGRGFMGKEWDAFVPQPSVWRECIRVLKPGGHLIAFGSTRTVDLVALGLRIAGFEIRDQVLWLYASGFPKSLNVSKAIDAHLGAEREVVGRNKWADKRTSGNGSECFGDGIRDPSTVQVTATATPEAQQFDGWGTAAKPAHEPAVLARKPLIGTVAANVLAWGTGGLNIAGCKIPFASDDDKAAAAAAAAAAAQRACQQGEGTKPFGGLGDVGGFNDGPGSLTPYLATLDSGRWPANLIHDGSEEIKRVLRNDADRYFYTAKASRDDRDDGLDGFNIADAGERAGGRTEGSAGLDNPRAGTRTKGRNTHPTVKPTDLMRYLCRLVTPPGGLILDPFCGSGSTGRAALLEGFRFVGIELLEDHARIARARIKCIADRGVQLQLTADAV